MGRSVVVFNPFKVLSFALGWLVAILDSARPSGRVYLELAALPFYLRRAGGGTGLSALVKLAVH